MLAKEPLVATSFQEKIAVAMLLVFTQLVVNAIGAIAATDALPPKLIRLIQDNFFIV
ncbi:MAG: hypothetical protein MJ223_01845 [Mycoplasmoidaceae bacterium]|nr:hypothetical protein [Mycoplasmoidaceae bacterium]